MDLEDIVVSEINHTEGKQMLYGITYMWNPKHYTHELIYKADIESQTGKTNLWSPNGMRGYKFGVWD